MWMLTRLQPYIQSVETPVDLAKDGLKKYYLKDLNKFTVSIRDAKGKKYNLKEIEPYLELRVKLEVIYFEN